MKHKVLMSFVALCICFLRITIPCYSQCTNTIKNPLQNVVAPQYNLSDTILNNQQAGEYYTIQNLTLGATYQFTSSVVGDYISIRDAYDSSILLASGYSPLTYIPIGSDIVSVHINLSTPPCGSTTAPGVMRTTAVQCTSCSAVPPKVGINTSQPAASLDVAGEILIGDSGRPPVAGMIRWNNTLQDFEGYNGNTWISLTKSNSNTGWGLNNLPDAQENNKIIASDGAQSDFFGSSVAISGDYAIVGCHSNDVGSEVNDGAAYIFKRSGSSWVEHAKLSANDGDDFDQFGASVAISGDYVIIGAPTDDIGSNVNQGSAYIFVRSGSTWVEQIKLTSSDGDDYHGFGWSVAITGDYVIIGAPLDNIGLNVVQGSAYIFVRSGANWTQQAKLTASDGLANAQFGGSVAISGDYVIIGAQYDDLKGSAYIFVRSASIWSEQVKLNDSVGSNEDNFGRSVAISGDYVIIGAPNDDIGSNVDQGSAYIFVRSGSTWVEQIKLYASDGSDGDKFGSSVSISGDYVVIGATFDNNGSAYIFLSWTQQAKLTASDGQTNDYFGDKIAISGNYVLIGAQQDDIGSTTNQGSAYIFHK